MSNESNVLWTIQPSLLWKIIKTTFIRILHPCCWTLVKVNWEKSGKKIGKSQWETCGKFQVRPVEKYKQCNWLVYWYSKQRILRTHTAIQIKHLYPAFTEDILMTSIDFSKSLLFQQNELWKNKDTVSCFDVTMDSYNGVEVCKVFCLYLLIYHVKTIIKY